MDSNANATVSAQEQIRAREQMYARTKDYTDTGNANLLYELVGSNLRFVAEREHWLIWRDGRWTVDTHEVFVREKALQVAKWYSDQARVLDSRGDPETANKHRKYALKCRDTGTLDRMTKELRLKVGVPITVGELDTNPWLLGVANGVVDLETGTLRTQESQADFVTKRCGVAYDPAATAPRWQQFIAEVTGRPLPPGDGRVGEFALRPDMARYLQKLVGYMATGSTREHKLFVAVGDGSNGKSLLFETVEHVLHDYAATLPAESLMARQAGDSERATPLIAGLAGKRFVLSSETKDEHQLDAGGVKNLTGDAKMTARPLYGAPTTFTVTHKIVLLTNLRPRVDHLDAAIRSRLHLIPFDRRWNRPGDIERDASLPDGDKTLAEALRAEAQGILTWIVEGALMYRAEGLLPPAEVLASTRDYVLSQDHLGRWLSEEMDKVVARDGLLASELYEIFQSWCFGQAVENPCRNLQQFGMALDKRAVEGERTRDGARRGLNRKLG